MTYTEKMRKSVADHGFTRRNYEFTAHVIKQFEPKIRARVADLFVSNLLGTPGFDEARFRRECGL